MENEFVSYAFCDLPRKKIIKYARQYDGVDMTRLIGANEEDFPFLVRDSIGGHSVMFWNTYNGMMEHLDEDPVRAYATVRYLLENAYPVFDSSEEALAWAREHNWPGKTRHI